MGLTKNLQNDNIFFEGNKRRALSKWQMTSAISRSRCDGRIRRREGTKRREGRGDA